MSNEKVTTKKYALIGENIGYSLSPKIHAAIYEKFSVAYASYKLFDIKSENLETEIINLKKLNGFNVTKPYKQKIIQFLDKIDNEKFSAVNTVVNKKGALIGYNTDYIGFLHHIKELREKSKIDIYNRPALVLGAGGVAEVIVPALMALGADVHIYNRTEKKAIALAKKFSAKVAACKNEKSYYVVVNCTSCGLQNGEDMSTNLDFSSTALAYDTIYFDTLFLQSAKSAGVLVAENGLNMLLYQAIAAHEIFFDVKIKNRIPTKDFIIEKLQI